MKSYKVQIEGLFVFLSLDGERGRYGFFSTFYVEANNAANAVSRVRELLRKRMAENMVQLVSRHFFSSFFLVKNIWEVDESALEDKKDKDLGFTFYRMQGASVLFAAMRAAFIRRFRPNFVVRLSG